MIHRAKNKLWEPRRELLLLDVEGSAGGEAWEDQDSV